MIADFTFIGHEGTLKWEVNPKTHILTITGFGSIPNYPDDYSLLPSWTRFRNYIYEVHLGRGIINIGSNAFFPFDHGKLEDLHPNLKRVLLSGTVKTIGESAFRANPNLTHVDLSLCQNLRSIGELAFASCFSLKTLDFSRCPLLKTVSLDAFDNCGKLTRIDFSGCRSLDADFIPRLRERLPSSTKIVMNTSTNYSEN